MTLAFVRAHHGGGPEEESMDATSMEATILEPLLWEPPAFVEIRMDAEIGSYQDDFDGDDWH
jgi:hypothetical protein